MTKTIKVLTFTVTQWVRIMMLRFKDLSIMEALLQTNRICNKLKVNKLITIMKFSQTNSVLLQLIHSNNNKIKRPK